MRPMEWNGALEASVYSSPAADASAIWPSILKPTIGGVDERDDRWIHAHHLGGSSDDGSGGSFSSPAPNRYCGLSLPDGLQMRGTKVVLVPLFASVPDARA